MVTDDPTIRFSWTLRSDDAERIKQTLDAAHPERIEERAVETAVGGDAEDLLLSVGLHLDQEVANLGPRAQLDGLTTVAALTGALDELMREAPTGFIVDARFDSVHVDAHPSVGRGTIVLVDREGARLVSTRQESAVAKAIEEAEGAREG